jgi:hypothetical protein
MYQGRRASRLPLGLFNMRRSGLKGRNICGVLRPFQGSVHFDYVPGATRFALASGFHISRLWRCITSVCGSRVNKSE